MSQQLFTIGHSTHPLAEFLDLLERNGIEVLIDIRRFPGSRKYPHFNRENLAAALAKSGIEYHWLQALGGRRPRQSALPSKNLGLRNESFRNYADYMLTDDFREGIEQMLALASRKRTAYMCSESVFWRCHRRLVSDFLLVHGMKVLHIMPNGDLRPHTLTEGARVTAGELTYPAAEIERRELPFD